MKNSSSFGRGVVRQAVAGLGVALFVSTSGFALMRDVTETRDVEAFHSIRVTGAIELRVDVGKEQHVEITTDDDFMKYVETEVRDGVLIIGTDREEDRGWFDSDDKVDVEISLPELNEIDIRGAVDGEIKGVKANEFMVDIRGAGHLEISGTCGDLELDIAGTGAVEAEDLKCENVDVSLRGAGMASVYASGKVDADLRGVGAINIDGDPKTVKKSVRGIGVIND